ncbi:hypothetical protein [Parabacteroides sp. PF5-9]|uniref:hypothetical protein n=1 Tax=Parabacteroides sp. PF5-9 TaxID=1742404 RepID=UPI002474C2A7|nr:hypothetical protein [Parabacteroides sp. PF5-9]MDH6356869.1 hypothetical protein [Parabacteroides sp. PF5-9]
MKRYWLVVLFLCCMFVVQAQSGSTMTINHEGKDLFIPPKKIFNFHLPEPAIPTYTPSMNLRMDSMLRAYSPDIFETSVMDRPMDMRVLSGAYQPFFNVYAPMLRRVSPMAFDFHETSMVTLTERTTWLTTGQQQTWPGAGGVTTISSGMLWKTGDLTVYGGGFAGRFYTPFNSSPELFGGAELRLGYELTDWMTLRGWGTYTHYGDERKNPHLMMNPFYYHTNVGGAAEFKINENFGLGVGVNYEYNHLQRRLEPQYLLYPVINSRNIQIKMW